ncbi:MAG: hypothetical protein HYY89_00995 [candidate division NC10 bacterium]|nr:hypothetical protein [candidate division NC10 bacterium]
MAAVVAMMVAGDAAAERRGRAANCEAPAKTRADMREVSATVSPAARARTPKPMA